MVKVYDIQTPTSINDQNFTNWCESIRPSDEEPNKKLWNELEKALLEVQEKNENLKEVYSESFEMANILSSLDANSTTLVAAIIYPFVNCKLIESDKLAERFGGRVASRIKGVASMDAIRALQADLSDNQDASHIDNLRKMLLTMRTPIASVEDQ